MPRKQNGFGSASSFAFNKVNNKISQGKRPGAAGYYPSDRQFGSSVHRSVIEKFDIDSNWVRWRKGLEFYYQAAWNRLQRKNPNYDPYNTASKEVVDFEIDAKLYQGTAGEIDVKFDGYRFATKNSDTANHYVIKRTPVNPTSLGVISTTLNDQTSYTSNFNRGEIWARVTPSSQSFMLRNMIGERITDGTDEAAIANVLTQNEKPSVYKGKTLDTQELTKVTVTVAKSALQSSSFVVANGGDINTIIGKLGYVKDFYIEQPITNAFTFKDVDGFNAKTGNKDYFTVDAEFSKSGVNFEILEPGQEFPPTLLDISSLSNLFTSTAADVDIIGKFFYDKSAYQRFFGQKYLTADVVRTEVTTASFVVFPFTILSIKEVGSNVEITSIPFVSESTLFAPLGTQATIIFNDKSFTKTKEDTDADGNYYHDDVRDENGVSLPNWTIIDTDIDPWAQNTFNSNQGLVPATVYACSCPAHSHAQLRMPQATESDNQRKVNRQQRFPLPTAMGLNRFDEGALTQTSGVLQSWATPEYKLSYKQCKHSIAARFIERNKTKEPNSYPSFASRQRFEETLKKEINDIPDEFRMSYERSGLSTLEVIFAMASALNLDDAELAFVVLNAS